MHNNNIYITNIHHKVLLSSFHAVFFRKIPCKIDFFGYNTYMQYRGIYVKKTQISKKQEKST